MAAAYSQLSVAQVSELKTAAAAINSEREKLLAAPLTDSAADRNSSMTQSQKDRLNQARLDISLQQVTGHAAWSNGLGLGDHVSALRPSYVTDHLGYEEQMVQVFKKSFASDMSIQKNNDVAASFSRSCLWGNSGICEKDPSFEHVKTLIGQFHMAIGARKYGTSPFIVKLHPRMVSDRGSSSSREEGFSVWMVIGAVQSKPISYTGIKLFVMDGWRLGMQTDAYVPRADSLHRVFRDMLRRQQVDNNASAGAASGLRFAANLSMQVRYRVWVLSFPNLVKIRIPSSYLTLQHVVYGLCTALQL